MQAALRLILDLVKPRRRTIVICGLFALLAAGFDTIAPLLLGRGVDAATRGGAFLPVAAALAVWFLVRTVADRLRTELTYHGGDVATEAAERFTKDAVVALSKKPLPFHYGNKGGEITEAVGQLRHELIDVIVGIGFDLVPAFVSAIAILAYLAVIDYRLALALGAGIAAYVAYTVKVSPLVIASQKARNAAHRKVGAFAWDSLRNILVVKSTTNEPFIERTLAGHSTEFLKVHRADERLDRSVLNAQNGIIAVSSFVTVLVAAHSIIAGTGTFGRLTAVIAYIFAVFGYIRYIQWQVRSLTRLSASHATVAEFLAKPSEDFSSGSMEALSGAVEFRNVRFRYREDRPALEDVNFVVKAGEHVAIVGESGEGKTTLVDLIGRYYEPQSGMILFDGTDAKGINLASLRMHMAYVPQDITLFHETLGFNIRYGRPEATDDELREAVRQAHLQTFVDNLPDGIETMVGERGLKLSGGERQRVALARAFLRDPRILILDEPTSNLDSATEQTIQESLAKLMAGRTTFVIAHRLRTVRDADRILVLKDGRIAESGTHDELVKKGGAYAALLAAQGGYIAPGEEHL
jgi:ABC-type multidrug transport system fused ATPase/permease subunit